MRRFVLKCNIERFEALLRTETDPATVARLQEMLAAERRQHALITSAEYGAKAPQPSLTPRGEPQPLDEAEFRAALQASPNPVILLDPGPGLRILEVNPRVEEVSGLASADVVGRPFFEVFPDNPGHALADGVSNLAESLRVAAATGRPHAMAPQRYDLPGDDGVYRTRYWAPVNTPVFDARGDLAYLVHESREVQPPAGASPN